MYLATPENIRERLLAGEKLLADGAMGTQLMGQGIAPNAVLAANREHPNFVQDIHRQYLAAGADLLTSNTFGIWQDRKCRGDVLSGTLAVFRATLETERETGILFSMLPDVLRQSSARSVQLTIIASDNPFCLLIETCTNINEARAAVREVRTWHDGLLMATCHFTAQGVMLDGTTGEQAARRLVHAGADVVGANCGDEPESFVSLARAFRQAVSVPLLFQPNAGLPTTGADGTLTYPLTPEAFGALAVQLWQEGVSIVGGCCGTTPAHIAAAHRAGIEANLLQLR